MLICKSCISNTASIFWEACKTLLVFLLPKFTSNDFIKSKLTKLHINIFFHFKLRSDSDPVLFS